MNHPPIFGSGSLDEILTECKRLLSRGVADRRSPLHTPTVATIGSDGAPRLRTMVLRAFDPAARILRFHTDLRSAKACEIANDPRVAIHAYDPGTKLQLRLDGTALIHRFPDPVAAAAWEASKPMSRICYATAVPPGTPLESPHPVAEGGDGREHFGVVVVELGRLEFLWLSHTGHRRGVYRWTGGGVEAGWLAP
ncbi:pyridoxamine 5'-phosphate oxidase family protein [Alsobacter sp. R-9]